MTVLIGLVHNGAAWIGADSAVHDGSLYTNPERKVWTQGPCVFGFTGVFREMQILKYRTQLPELPEDRDVLEWLACEFSDAVRSAREAADYKNTDNGNATSPHLLVACRGRLFTYYSEHSVAEHLDFYTAGSGGRYALGSLHTSACFWKSPRKRIEAALDAACEFDVYCRGPYTIVRAQ